MTVLDVVFAGVDGFMFAVVGLALLANLAPLVLLRWFAEIAGVSISLGGGVPLSVAAEGGTRPVDAACAGTPALPGVCASSISSPSVYEENLK